MVDSIHANGRPAPLLELRQLSKRYQEGDRWRTVISNADASVMPGEFAVLLGPSGSGKSTLLNLISGIDVPTSGEVLIGGASLTSLSEKERTLFRRKNLGIVFQFFNLLPTLTVLENLLLPLDLNGVTGGRARDTALELLRAVGLADRAGSFPDRLSGGEQQRIAIARALVHNPLLVLADEPTGNLDAETGAQAMDLLEVLSRRKGRTLVVVSHSPNVVRRADRVFQVRGGRLEEMAPGAVPGAILPAPGAPGRAAP